KRVRRQRTTDVFSEEARRIAVLGRVAAAGADSAGLGCILDGHNTGQWGASDRQNGQSQPNGDGAGEYSTQRGYSSATGERGRAISARRIVFLRDGNFGPLGGSESAGRYRGQ